MILKTNGVLFASFLSLILTTKLVTGSTKCSAPIRAVATKKNLLRNLSVRNEMECEDACERDLDCKFYTYYHQKNSSLSSGQCSLLNEFGSEVVTACKDGTCITGSPNCRESSCGYVLNDQIYPAILLSNVTSQFTNIGLLTIGDCTPPVIIAIGAGGRVQAPLGGGSGFIEYKILEDTNTQTLTHLVAAVGGDWIMNPMDPDYKASIVTYAATNTVLVRAEHGGERFTRIECGGMTGDTGCPGYSGSGGGGVNQWRIGGSGGSNGGDGGNSQYSEDFITEGGKGSGLHVAGFVLQNFILRPGRGGTGNTYYSGGGGGVLVNGESNDCNCVHAGEGFGGGGGYGCTNKNGAIILDFCFHQGRCYTTNG